jgi:hypothetical protein
MNTPDGMCDVPYDAWKVYPILHLDAPWQQLRIEHLALDVRLIWADDACLEQLEKHRDLSTVFPWVFDPKVGVVRWLLALRVPQAVDHVPSTDVGFSFAEKVEDAIAGSFVACLKILRSTRAVCPLSYFGEVGVSTVKILGCPPWDIATADTPPRCDWPEEFTEKDLWQLPKVWTGMVKLRELDTWMTAPFQELFFQRLSQAAREKAEAELLSRMPGGIPENTAEEIVKHLCQETGWDSAHSEALRSLFEEEKQKTFNIGTRIGRAVGIFEEGVHLPHLHAFLSACLVLETLFTLGEGEVTHKLATRLAKVVVDEDTPDERLDLFKRAKKVYTARSQVVHGKRAITDVSEDARKDAFNLTRKALQKILAESHYLGLYTAPTDNEGRGRLSDFFESLDLR